MDLQPRLENELILLRPLKDRDFEALFRAAQDPLIWEQHPAYNRYQREAFTLFFQQAIESQRAFAIIDKKTKTIIGSSRYNLLHQTEQVIEIGWTFLARTYWGGVYNKALKQLMLDHIFQYVEAVVFYIASENKRSQAASLKLGAKEVSLTTYPYLKKEGIHNGIFLLSKEDWIDRPSDL
ncbi:MAG: GNAT family N-acetyltransferase [Bacteroidota bacterium]